MAKFNWDKARMENLVERKGAEYIRKESERYTGLQHDKKRDLKNGPRYCPHCDDPVTLEGLRTHILKHHRPISRSRERKPSIKIRHHGQGRVMMVCPQCGVSVRRLQKHLNKSHGEVSVSPQKKRPARETKALPTQAAPAGPYHINLFFVPRTKKRAALAEEILRQQGATVILKQVKDDRFSAGLGGKVYYFPGTMGSLSEARAIALLLKDVSRLAVGEVTLDAPSPVPYSIWLIR